MVKKTGLSVVMVLAVVALSFATTSSITKLRDSQQSQASAQLQTQTQSQKQSQSQSQAQSQSSNSDTKSKLLASSKDIAETALIAIKDKSKYEISKVSDLRYLNNLSSTSTTADTSKVDVLVYVSFEDVNAISTHLYKVNIKGDGSTFNASDVSDVPVDSLDDTDTQFFVSLETVADSKEFTYKNGFIVVPVDLTEDLR